ncbi:unnamed protein product [Blepharisma stoltei]|uniref:Uncharacterized protein n=1 Tax=Blepharisma stoltei TaxID=1481888 RepID=A0AAU9JF12_9CILI|nr:unnamed protein product [Blepharisma stoltei]
MGCGIPQKSFRSKRNKVEEGDTSLQDLNINNDSPSKTKLSEQGQFWYNVNGTAYRIVVSGAISPDKSQVFN